MTPESARALAEEYFNGGRPNPVDVALYVFDAGFVAWTRDSTPEDPTVLPTTVGGGCIIIDRHTGDVCVRPLLSPEHVAAQWPDRTPR
ncbi:hypothetical protein Aph01nite_53440 [Acrocarpospora phusangensis]|uniref:Immunity protein 35 domain-containing protein n=1 Tax=Acrocarpospora phusangensis TaxID=1070424 RepID=A0A919UMK3_9ACTN|nr:hypothetical protein [Acrocarpospora phusangensis]GIH27034.1 hypothetical protein Aph01nite_53440 [Acrocarpospora phusangensis]